MTVADVTGVKLAGLMLDAGPVSSPVLLRVGTGNAHKSDLADPTTLSDVFFRIGGATGQGHDEPRREQRRRHPRQYLGLAGRPRQRRRLDREHGRHLERRNGGRVIFFQNEMPYDPPSQSARMEAPGVPGWAAFKVADTVTSFSGTGMGSYSFFNQGVDIFFAARAFEVPDTLPPGSRQDLLTIFLDPSRGMGGILNVINDTGGSSTIANPDVPVAVVSYP
jgi:hypothetical protein